MEICLARGLGWKVAEWEMPIRKSHTRLSTGTFPAQETLRKASVASFSPHQMHFCVPIFDFNCLRDLYQRNVG